MGEIVLSSRIRRYLKEFGISLSWRVFVYGALRRPLSTPAAVKTTTPGELMDILETLPGVQALEIKFLHFEPDATWDTREAVRGLDKLKLNSGVVCSHLALNIIRYFTEIRELSVIQGNRANSNYTVTPLPLPLRLSPRINHLVLSIRQLEKDALAINNLCTHVDLSTLITLYMPSAGSSPHSQYNRAFHALLSRAPNLASFAGSVAAHLDLISYPTRLPKLRTLVLQARSPNLIGQVGGGLETISNVLACSMMSNVEHLALQYVFFEPFDWEPEQGISVESLFKDALLSFDWPRIDQAFARFKSAKLLFYLDIDDVKHVGDSVLPQYRAIAEEVVLSKVSPRTSAILCFDVFPYLQEILDKPFTD